MNPNYVSLVKSFLAVRLGSGTERDCRVRQQLLEDANFRRLHDFYTIANESVAIKEWSPEDVTVRTPLERRISSSVKNTECFLMNYWNFLG
jgi:hypothetical protein